MKKKFAVLVAALILAEGISGLRADEVSSRLEAIILVKKAVAFLVENGKGKALEEFSKPAGRFSVRDHYIFAYEVNGKCVANAADHTMVGRTTIAIAGRTGKQGMIEQAADANKSEIGWQYCVFADPAKNKAEKKLAYLEKVGDIVIGCGTR